MISGKGGTGKTSITASLAALFKNAVMADCDVDAADLYLVLTPQNLNKFEFKGNQTADINPDKCIQCGKCEDICRFSAIKDLAVNSAFCEGCRVCKYICPQDAITMKDNVSGHWYRAKTDYGPMVYAKLGIAEENSGKLVAEVKKTARQIAKEENLDYIIIDGPPGIGCPVISSLSGVDMAIVVTEPTVAGKHDLKRLLELSENFNVPIKVIINKYDIALDQCQEIEDFCINRGIEVLGKIPFDEDIVYAIANTTPPVIYSSGPAVKALEKIACQILTACG